MEKKITFTIHSGDELPKSSTEVVVFKAFGFRISVVATTFYSSRWKKFNATDTMEEEDVERLSTDVEFWAYLNDIDKSIIDLVIEENKEYLMK